MCENSQNKHTTTTTTKTNHQGVLCHPPWHFLTWSVHGVAWSPCCCPWSFILLLRNFPSWDCYYWSNRVPFILHPSSHYDGLQMNLPEEELTLSQMDLKSWRISLQMVLLVSHRETKEPSENSPTRLYVPKYELGCQAHTGAGSSLILILTHPIVRSSTSKSDMIG